jgi:ABC-2 type transport system permease protein
MNSDEKSRPSFSPVTRWRIGFDVVLRTVLVLAVVVMANYLGARFFHRYYMSSQTRVALSSRTLAVLRSVTNRVDVILYFDRKADFFSDIEALLKEYRAANKNIFVQTVDYVRDPGQAEIIRKKYQQYFTSQSDKDLIIFDSGGRVKVFPASLLVTHKDELVGSHPKEGNPKQSELEFERRPVSFNGEQAFTSILLALSNPQPRRAYFLQKHGEASLTDSGNAGYQKFMSVLQENYISVTNLDWVGNGVPADSDLLIIAGPTEHFTEPELQQIAQYLREGGRLLMLFNFASQGRPTGLESILQSWGVGVEDDIVQDAKHTITTHDIVLSNFGKHPIVDALSGGQLQVYMPRPILNLHPSTPNAPQVDELFGTSADGTLLGNSSEPPHNYPLAVAVEMKPVAGATNPRGNTRIVVVGDDIFLGNYYIDAGGNRDFLNAAINWLVDRPLLLAGIEPRPVTNLRLQITQYQQRQLSWLLLGALPGGVLVLGWVVWLVRRK